MGFANSADHEMLLREWLPELGVTQLVPLPHYGWGGENDVYLADGRLIVRFPRSAEAAKALEVEARLLPQIAERVPVSVPRFERLPRDPATGLPCFVAYPVIPGEPLRGAIVRQLETADPTAFARIARDVGGFLAGLHSLPIETAVAAGLSPPGLTIRQGVECQCARLRADLLPRLEADVAAALDRLLDSCLDDPASFDWPPVVCHGDLSSDHLLVEQPSPSRLSGVIDFGDLSIGDPAGELTWRAEYGEEFFWRVLEAYNPASNLAAFARAVDFRWRLVPTVEILYGLENGIAAYVAEGRRELRQRLLGA